MSTYLVLHSPSAASSRTGEELRQWIARLSPVHLRMVGSMWLIQSEDMADTIRDALCARVPPDDALVVLSIGEQGAWRGLSEEHMRWLADRL